MTSITGNASFGMLKPLNVLYRTHEMVAGGFWSLSRLIEWFICQLFKAMARTETIWSQTAQAWFA